MLKRVSSRLGNFPHGDGSGGGDGDGGETQNPVLITADESKNLTRQKLNAIG